MNSSDILELVPLIFHKSSRNKMEQKALSLGIILNIIENAGFI